MSTNLNDNIAETEGTLRVEAIAGELVTVRILNMGLHFLPLRKSWLQDRCTWRMHRDRLEVQYQTDYILGTYCRLFQDVAIRDP